MHMHTYRVQFTTPRRITDSIGELTGYDEENPNQHEEIIRVVAPKVGYKPSAKMVEGYLNDYYGISAYQNLKITKAEEPVAVHSVIGISRDN